MTNTTLILDSSVIAKWFFPEIDSKKALAIKDKFINNEINIAIPVLLYYEINNLLRTAAKTYRIDTDEARNVYHAFLQLNFISYSSELLLDKTLETTLKFNLSSYDASYVALSEYLQVQLLTSDQKLLNRVSNKLVINLKEYIL